MQDVLTQYHNYAEGILSQLSAQNRTKLAKEIAKKLRENNRKRIADQIDPGGIPFKSKKQLRKKKGKFAERCLQNYALQNISKSKQIQTVQ